MNLRLAVITATLKNSTLDRVAALQFFIHSKPDRSVLAILLGIFVLFGMTSGHAQLPPGWSAADIGNPGAGSSSFSNGIYTVTGSGSGMQQESDHLHFTYQTLNAGGNFRLTARIVSFNGGNHSEVGLMVRQGTSANSSMGAVAYQPAAGHDTSPNMFSILARNLQADARYPWRNFGMNSAMGVPCWLQLVRYENHFAVYKSVDGKFWAQVHNASGSAFSVPGPIQVGFFVSSGGTSTATATIDSVKLETNPVLPYESSWIGNNFSSDYESYVSGGTTAMWVGPDGTCYATSSWDEGGEPGKSYKDGKVVRGFTRGPGHSYEGGITSDGTHLYYSGGSTEDSQLSQVNMLGSYDGPYQPLYLQTPLIDPKGGMLKLSGLACGNGELYASDELTGQVLVINPSQTTYGAPSNVVCHRASHSIDVSGVSNPAPEAIYQSAFQCDFVALTIPGMTAGHSYNVRLHFAETNPDDAAVGKRLMNLSVGDKLIPNYDIYAAAGALYKATAVSFDGVTPDAAGKLELGIQRANTTVDGSVAICGVEVLNSDGTPFLCLNCGGDTIGKWQTTIHEIPSRAFPFTRPGPIAVDKNGNLWIVQEGSTFPAALNFNPTPGWAAIKLYDKNGHYLNREITDVVNPTALSYDSAGDRLLVAENGPAQNIRIYNVYTGTSTVPACTSTFGVNGGIFAGKTPGLIHDPASGGDARFFGPTGVGMDAAGNIYVACDQGQNTNQTDIRAFAPNGHLLWSLFGLETTNTGDFDPTRGDSDVWTTTHHYTMNYQGSKAGGEWKLKSYITNPFARYPFPSNLGGGSSVYRKLSGTPILYTAGQGVLGPIYIYRFSGEQIIPCGSFSEVPVDGGGGIAIWIDANGDGIQKADEVSVIAPSGGFQSFDVDTNGDIYLAMGEVGGIRPKVEKFPFQGFNSRGAPIYSTTHTLFASPEAFNDPNTGNVRRLCYAGGTLDTMYLLGATNPRAKDGNYGGTLGCYDHWSTTPTKRFVTVLPTPATDPSLIGGAPPFQIDGFIYEAFDVAHGISFVSDLWGTIRVIDSHGNLVMNMVPGPEIEGGNAWEDENMGVRAHYNPERGEYDILQENSGFRARQNFYRWKPSP